MKHPNNSTSNNTYGNSKDRLSLVKWRRQIKEPDGETWIRNCLQFQYSLVSTCMRVGKERKYSTIKILTEPTQVSGYSKYTFNAWWTVDKVAHEMRNVNQKEAQE